MKYLKKFNESETYSEIDFTEFMGDNGVGFGTENFTKVEMSIISDFLKSMGVSTTVFSSFIYGNKDNKFSLSAFTIEIYKHYDEWFFIKIWYRDNKNNAFYKCDQFEGVIELLNANQQLIQSAI
jgi:hypothetical protein